MRKLTERERVEIKRLRQSTNEWDHMRAANIEKWGLAPEDPCPESEDWDGEDHMFPEVRELRRDE